MLSLSKKRILIIANTYYQMILAIQLRCKNFSDCDVVLLLSDHSNNMDKIAKKISELNLFAESHFIKTKQLNYQRSKIQKIKEFFQIAFSIKSNCKEYLEFVDNKYFDEVIFYNFSSDVFKIYDKLKSINNYLKISMFEEGLFSYKFDAVFPKFIKAALFLRSLLHVNTAFQELKNFYCYYPSVYRGILTPVAVPKIAPNDSCSINIKKIFETEKLGLSYSQKYIYFTSVYDFEGGEAIGEYEVACNIAALVGKENLLIKMHPRDTRSIYVDNSFTVDKNSNIPWEVIQLSRDFSDKVFLTATSGSVLSGSLLSEIPVKTFFLYKLCKLDGNVSARSTVESIDDLINKSSMKDAFNNVFIPEKIDEILK